MQEQEDLQKMIAKMGAQLGIPNLRLVSQDEFRESLTDDEFLVVNTDGTVSIVNTEEVEAMMTASCN
jgi:serine/threonine protein phosphatase PrpC